MPPQEFLPEGRGLGAASFLGGCISSIVTFGLNDAVVLGIAFVRSWGDRGAAAGTPTPQRYNE